MGVYVNAAGGKENWLLQNGEVTREPNRFDAQPGKLAVCLIDNGIFTAAGVAYSQRELEAFADPTDRRAKFWFWVNVGKLFQVSNLSDYVGASTNV